MQTVLLNEQNRAQFTHQPQCVLALGFFDGVHKGHQVVIEEAKKEARRRQLPLAVMSFTPHPINVLTNGKQQIPMITTIEEKERLLSELGVDLFYVMTFTKSFAQRSPAHFVTHYLQFLNAVHVVAGFDFSFGKKGCGTLADIPLYAPITYTEVPCIKYNNEKISSTAVRQMIQKRQIKYVMNYLGRPYETVVNVLHDKCCVAHNKMPLPEGHYVVEVHTTFQRFITTVFIDQHQHIYMERLTFHASTLKVRWLDICVDHQLYERKEMAK